MTPACDWYAVGVMLYEALSGKRPFDGTWMEVLQSKQSQDAPPLPTDAAIPSDLAKLCMKLLPRDPAQRASGVDISKSISRRTEAKQTPVKQSKEETLVGRDAQMKILSTALSDLEENQQAVTVFVSGRSGEGKSVLIDHFLKSIRKNDRYTVLSGRCYDRESVPFKALDSLIDALATHLRILPAVDATFLLPDDIGFLSHLFPVLKRVEVVAKASNLRVAGLDDQQVRKRAFTALRALLRRASTTSTVVMFIDDLQWGDSDSAEGLVEVLRPPEAPPLLFLGSYRVDEADTSPFLQTWSKLSAVCGLDNSSVNVKVGPFTLDECTQITIGHVGEDSEGVRRYAADLFSETDGNPYLLTELVSSYDGCSGSNRLAPIHEVIAQKLAMLPKDATGLLDVISVSGQALSLEEASQASGLDTRAFSTMTHMQNERLLKSIGPDEATLVDTYHDKIREAVLDQLEDEQCRQIHLALAETIEDKIAGVSKAIVESFEEGETLEKETKEAIPRVYDLAYHFDAAGERRKAWVYGLLAAEQARRQYSLEVATEQYAIAQRNLKKPNNAIRYRIAEGFGQTLMLLGRYEEANHQLNGAIDLAEKSVGKASIEALLGEIAFKQGALSESLALYESGLRRLGSWAPQTTFGLVWALICELVLQCGHSLLPGRLHKKPTNNQLELTTHLFTLLGRSAAFINTPKWLWATLAGLNRAEMVAPSHALAFNYAIHGTAMTAIGWHKRSSRYADRSLKLSHELNDDLEIGHSLLWKGVASWASGRYEEGIGSMTEAIELFDKAGDLGDLNFARFHLSCCQYAAGNLAKAAEEARRTFELSVRIGDPRANCSLYLWSKATHGNLPFDELKKRFPCNPLDILSTCNVDKGEGYWHLFHGRTEQAVEAFKRACDRPLKHQVLIFHSIAGVSALVTALRMHADELKKNDAKQAKQLRKRAMRLAKRAAWLSLLFPIEHPQSLRELSLLHQTDGRFKTALKYAEKSCDVADKQKARYEYAQSALVRAKLKHSLGLPGAAAEVEQAEAAMDPFEKTIQEAVSQNNVILSTDSTG